MKAICSRIPQTVMVLGPSGSGKDTQMELLDEKCDFELIGTGDMLRDEYERKTELGLKAYETWGKGIWTPDEIVYEIFPKWLKKFDSQKPWIFSQTVRTVPQIALFDKLLEKYDRKLEKVIYFSLSDEAAIERMSMRRICPKCKRDYHLKFKKPKKDGICDDDGTKLVIREDDYPDAIRQRLREFENKVKPVLEQYEKRGILVEVDASPSIPEVYKSFMNKLVE